MNDVNTVPRRRSLRGALEAMARADLVAAGFIVLAIVFTVGALFGAPGPGRPSAYVEAAPLISMGLIVAMMGMFFDLIRHGVARVILSVCALLLASFGVVFARQAPLTGVALCYWVPAVLTMVAVLMLEKGHRTLSGAQR